MKKLLFLVLPAIFLFACNSGKNNDKEDQQTKEEQVDFSDEISNTSYSIGMQISESLITGGLNDYVNIDKIVDGLNDQLDEKSDISLQEADQILQSFVVDIQNSVDVSSSASSASYAIGVQIGENFIMQGLDTVLNIGSLKIGLKDHFEKKSKIGIEEANQNVQKFFSEFQKSQSGDKIAEGEKFLEENGKRSEVTTTESGLQYEVLEVGNGPKPSLSSTVKTHYHGTLLDGTVFDSSVERGEPISFPLTGVISGWTEALQLMPVGSKWKLYLPYDLAYGEKGSPGGIAPYETLIFEVELIDIEK